MWIFGIGFFVMLCALAAKDAPIKKPATVTSGALQRPPSALQLLAHHINHRLPVHPMLPHAAMQEAYRMGDWQSYNTIQHMFFTPSQESESTQVKHKPMPKAQSQIATKIGSPIEGVADEEWSQFASCFATHEPTFKDEQHVGRFFHHKNRLAELGIDPAQLADEQSQYKAFEADIKDTMVKHAKFINEFSGDVISINGQDLSISRSGVLALLKCAGPDNARAWLTDPSIRMKFPQTVKLVTAANQLF